MKAPGADYATADIAKLRDNCLDPHHPRGRHKARVFAAALGLARDALLAAARELRRAMRELESLSTVALLEDIAAPPLRRGQVGAIVERLAPGVCEVEFSDDEGRTYASLALSGRPTATAPSSAESSGGVIET